MDCKITNSNRRNLNLKPKRLYFNYFKDLFIHFNGTVVKQDENDSFEHMFLKPIIYRKDEEKVDISGMTSINTDLAFATKHESWKYEKEVRLIVYNPNKEESFYGIPLDKNSCVEAIYFGCRCEQKTINTIKNLFSKSDTPPKFYQMKLDRTDVYHLKWKEVE